MSCIVDWRNFPRSLVALGEVERVESQELLVRSYDNIVRGSEYMAWRIDVRHREIGRRQ